MTVSIVQKCSAGEKEPVCMCVKGKKVIASRTNRETQSNDIRTDIHNGITEIDSKNQVN